MSKIFKEEWKVYGNVFDNYTLRNLFKLQCQGHFEKLLSPIALGKEANVFTALTKQDTTIIIKIYRLQTCNFNKMYDYIKADPRFINLKKQRRKVIFSWTLREYRNLLKSREFITVPKPIEVLDNILLLELIGNDKPAPKIKDIIIPNIDGFAKKIINNMKKLHIAGIVHGDLSEYNILYNQDEPIFIDFSQTTVKNDPNYDEYLDRDIKNITRYLNKIGYKITEDQLKKKVYSK